QNALVRPLGRGDDLVSVTMNSEGTRILGVGANRRVLVWDDGGRITGVVPARGTATAPRLFVRRTLILTRLGDTLRLSDQRGRRILEVAGTISAVSHDAGRLVVQNNKERTLTFWSVAGEQLKTITHDKEVTRLFVNRDGSRAAVVA